QTAAAARQIVPAGTFASEGQRMLVPVHVSGASHTAVEGRQTVPAFPAGCAHAALLPEQMSAVHGLPSSAQAVPSGLNPSLGQLALVPEHVSAVSHAPAASRQTVPAATNASFGHAPLEPVQLSATSHEAV